MNIFLVVVLSIIVFCQAVSLFIDIRNDISKR